jgi:small-conductance mechanosensitive channel
MDDWQQQLGGFAPALITIAATIFLVWMVNTLVKRTAEKSSTATPVIYQVLRLLLILLAIIAIILLLPISDETQGQVLRLTGLVITAILTISSTSFVSNMMAGLMLQSTETFRPGDYIRVGDEFGRVTRRSLLHTQIQTEWRDITTLPNLLLVNSPITVLHREGTVISADVSLGYDIPYTTVEKLLGQAADESGLSETFVLTQDLLDHAVNYRVAGFLPEMKNLISARSNLRKKILEVMHGHGLEVASPTIMDQRPKPADSTTIPEQPVRHGAPQALSAAPEDIIFDKAEEAASLEELRQQGEEFRQQLKDLKATRKTVTGDDGQAVEREIEIAEKRLERIGKQIERREKS